MKNKKGIGEKPPSAGIPSIHGTTYLYRQVPSTWEVSIYGVALLLSRCAVLRPTGEGMESLRAYAAWPAMTAFVPGQNGSGGGLAIRISRLIQREQ